MSKIENAQLIVSAMRDTAALMPKIIDGRSILTEVTTDGEAVDALAASIMSILAGEKARTMPEALSRKVSSEEELLH